MSLEAFLSLTILIPTCMLTAPTMALFLVTSSLFQSPPSSIHHIFSVFTSFLIYLVFYVFFSTKSLANTQNSSALLTSYDILWQSGFHQTNRTTRKSIESGLNYRQLTLCDCGSCFNSSHDCCFCFCS